MRPAWPDPPGLQQLAVIRMMQGFLAGWLFLSIQLWISLRWRSFPVGLTVGIPKRQANKPQSPKDDLDKLVDDLDNLGL